MVNMQGMMTGRVKIKPVSVILTFLFLAVVGAFLFSGSQFIIEQLSKLPSIGYGRNVDILVYSGLVLVGFWTLNLVSRKRFKEGFL